MNPLNSIPAAIVSGVVLAIIVIVIIPGLGFNEFSLARWLHILSGIMWIGLLYYVNVAQDPGARRRRRRQGRARRRGHHQVRGVACVAVVPLSGCRDVADGRLVSRSQRRLRRRVHARHGR